MAENKQYREGDVYHIYNKRKSKLLYTIVIPEHMCKSGLDRMLFFKYNIPPGDYSAEKVGSSE